jgi:hypothetical protein
VFQEVRDSVQRSFPDEELDLRFGENVQCFYASENPYLKNKVSEMFKSSGLEFQDIEIVLAFMPQRMNMLGGYMSKRRTGQDVTTLYQGLRPFPLPIILINIASPICQVRENILEIVIHELRHFVDDMMIVNGLADESLMPDIAPQQNNTPGEAIRYWNQYLTSPTEISAHAEEIIATFDNFSVDYVKENYALLKDRVIRRIMLSDEKDRSDTERGHMQYSLYAAIFDQAYKLYTNQEEKTG